MSNNTFLPVTYNPEAPVPIHHWQMELATICIVNSLTLITLVARTSYRWAKLKRFRREDRWIVGATIALIGLFVCQLGASMNGSGLRTINAPSSWLKPHWIFSWGWIGYYLSISMIKVALCCCLLEFLPAHFKIMRRSVVGLCFFIMTLGIAESLLWLFQYIDIPRYVWSTLSIPVDIAILSVPFEVIRRTGLQPHEKKVLKLVFAANLLGTIACGCGIYGVYVNRQSVQDVFYSETAFIMINDAEIFCYAVGATSPIFSRFFISKSAPSSQAPKPSWLRTVSSSLAFPFIASNSTLTTLPRRKSRGSTHPNLLPISEISTNSRADRNGSAISDFITVPEKLNESSMAEVGTIEREMAIFAPSPTATRNDVITPSSIYSSSSTRTENLRKNDSSLAIDDLESGYRYDVWVKDDIGSEESRNEDFVMQPNENRHITRTTALYD